MYEKLQLGLEELFQDAPKTVRAKELKEELMANLIDKYNDLLASGKTEDEAVQEAIDSVGDVSDLIRGLKESSMFDSEKIKKDREKRALINAIAIGLYIISFGILIFVAEVLEVREDIGFSIMLMIDAVATGMLVYNANSRPKYVKTDESIVEEFKEWKSTNDTSKEVLKSIRSIIWTLILVIYFVVSFGFGIWAYSWIIFIIGVAVERIVSLIFQLRK